MYLNQFCPAIDILSKCVCDLEDEHVYATMYTRPHRGHFHLDCDGLNMNCPQMLMCVTMQESSEVTRLGCESLTLISA